MTISAVVVDDQIYNLAACIEGHWAGKRIDC